MINAEYVAAIEGVASPGTETVLIRHVVRWKKNLGAPMRRVTPARAAHLR